MQLLWNSSHNDVYHYARVKSSLIMQYPQNDKYTLWKEKIELKIHVL